MILDLSTSIRIFTESNWIPPAVIRIALHVLPS